MLECLVEVSIWTFFSQVPLIFPATFLWFGSWVGKYINLGPSASQLAASQSGGRPVNLLTSWVPRKQPADSHTVRYVALTKSVSNHQSVHRSVSPSVHQCPSVRQSVSLSVRQSVSPSVSQPCVNQHRLTSYQAMEKKQTATKKAIPSLISYSIIPFSLQQSVLSTVCIPFPSYPLTVTRSLHCNTRQKYSVCACVPRRWPYQLRDRTADETHSRDGSPSASHTCVVWP